MLSLPTLSRPLFLRNEKLENRAQPYRYCHSSTFIFNHLINNELCKNVYENLACFLNIIMLLPVGGEVNLWLSRSIILKYTIEHSRNWAPKLHLIIKLKKVCPSASYVVFKFKRYRIHFTISEQKVLLFHYCFLIATNTAKNRTFI